MHSKRNPVRRRGPETSLTGIVAENRCWEELGTLSGLSKRNNDLCKGVTELGSQPFPISEAGSSRPPTADRAPLALSAWICRCAHLIGHRQRDSLAVDAGSVPVVRAGAFDDLGVGKHDPDITAVSGTHDKGFAAGVALSTMLRQLPSRKIHMGVSSLPWSSQPQCLQGLDDGLVVLVGQQHGQL